MSLVGGAWIVLQVGPRSVFLIFGALTLVSLAAALLLPRLPPEPATQHKGFRLPIPHRLEAWGFVMGFSGDGVFLLTLAFLLKDSVTSVAAVMATASLLALRWLVEITTGPLGGWIGDRFGARRIAIANATVLVAGLRTDRARPRRDRRAAGRAEPRHVQHADPCPGDRARPRRACCHRRRAIRPGATSAPPSGPLSAPWLFLNVAQGPLYGALAAALGLGRLFLPGSTLESGPFPASFPYTSCPRCVCPEIRKSPARLSQTILFNAAPNRRTCLKNRPPKDPLRT